jgi:Polyketide cyclase / dehydrase and lipid transport
MRALPVDGEFVHIAKARAVAAREMAVSAEQVFATLEDGPSWSKWVPVIREVTWTSPKPFATGTTRTVALLGGISVDELYWAWEPNRRMGFSVAATNIGWIDALAEDSTSYPCPPNAATCAGHSRCRSGARRATPRLLVTRVLPAVQRQLLKKLERVAGERSVRA